VSRFGWSVADAGQSCQDACPQKYPCHPISFSLLNENNWDTVVAILASRITLTPSPVYDDNAPTVTGGTLTVLRYFQPATQCHVSLPLGSTRRVCCCGRDLCYLIPNCAFEQNKVCQRCVAGYHLAEGGTICGLQGVFFRLIKTLLLQIETSQTVRRTTEKSASRAWDPSFHHFRFAILAVCYCFVDENACLIFHSEYDSQLWHIQQRVLQHV
jgi:hypothetical protein